MSSACVPCSMMAPLSITRMVSASRMVDRRWAMTKLVRSFISSAMACWMSTSVRVSTELVASSRIRMSRVGQERAGDGEQLLLALRDVGGVVVDHGVVALGQGADEVVHAGGARGGADLVLGRALAPVGDVLADGAAEQPRVLQHHAEQAAQVAARHVLRVHAVHDDAPAVDLVEAQQQVDQRGLAGAGGPDDGHGLAGLHVQGEVLDERRVGQVAERDVLELDVAAACARTARTPAGRAPLRLRRAARRRAPPRPPCSAARS